MLSQKTIELNTSVFEFEGASAGTKQKRPAFESGVKTFVPPCDLFDATSCSLADQLSGPQIRIIRRLAGDAGIDECALTINLFGCEFLELSKKAASVLINYLENNKAAVLNNVSLRLAG